MSLRFRPVFVPRRSATLQCSPYVRALRAPARGMDVGMRASSAALRRLSLSSSAKRGPLLAERWRGCGAQLRLPMTHYRLLHSRAVPASEDNSNRLFILGKGMIPLDIIAPQSLRNEVANLERSEHAVIPPHRFCSLLVSCSNPTLRARILKLADKVADLSSPESASHSYSLIFHALWKSHVLQRSELDPLVATLLSKMRDQEVPVNNPGLNYLVNLYISYGDVVKARGLFDLLREGEGDWKMQPNVMSYTTLTRGLASSGDLPQVMRYFDQMKRDGLRPDCKAFTVLLHACAQAADLPRALQVWDEMKRPEAGITLDTYALNSLLDTCNKVLDLDLALKLVDEMQDKWNIEPDAITYSSLIDLCGRLKDFGKAHELINEMRERGIAPTVYTFTSLISSYAETGDVQRCFEVLAQMTAERVRPTVVTLASLVNACLNAGDFRKAVETLGRMKRDFNVAPNAYVLGLLIDKAGPKAKTADLIRLLERIEQTEGTQLEIRTYGRLIGLCGARNELELAFLVYEKAHQPSKNADPAGQRLLERCLINACLQMGNSRKALDIVDSLIQRETLSKESTTKAEISEADEEEEEEETQRVVDVNMFNMLLRSVDVNAVESVVERMKILRVPPNMRTIDLLITHFEANDRLDRMWSLLRELQDKKVIQQDDLIYNSFIKVFLRRGQVAKARSVLTQLLDQGTSLPPATYHLFLETRHEGMNPVDDTRRRHGQQEDSEEERREQRRRAGEQAPLIPELVELMYEKNPTTPSTALLPFIRFCVQNRQIEKLDGLVQQFEQKAGRGAALVDRMLAMDEDDAFTPAPGSNTSDRVMHKLAPVLKAYILLHETDRAIELIRTIRQHGIQVEPHIYHALVRLATPESPGSALRLRALMRQDRVQDEDDQDPFAPLEHQAPPQRHSYNHHRRHGRRQLPVVAAALDRQQTIITAIDLDLDDEYAHEGIEQQAKTTTTTTTAKATPQAEDGKQRKKDKKAKEAKSAPAEGTKRSTRPPPSGALPRPASDLLSLSFSLLGEACASKPK